jgi:ubiquinone/menaquinone biosynthesis C-methylase UbiE
MLPLVRGRMVAMSLENEGALYGTDISLEMFRKSQQFAQRDNIKNMNFAGADGESLPFVQEVSECCLFCGSLHIFLDTKKVLKRVEARRPRCSHNLDSRGPW